MDWNKKKKISDTRSFDFCVTNRKCWLFRINQTNNVCHYGTHPTEQKKPEIIMDWKQKKLQISILLFVLFCQPANHRKLILYCKIDIILFVGLHLMIFAKWNIFLTAKNFILCIVYINNQYFWIPSFDYKI